MRLARQGPFFFIFCALGASESKTGGGNKKTKREGRNRVVCEYPGVGRCILYLRSKYGRMHVISRFHFVFFSALLGYLDYIWKPSDCTTASH